jgi:hypothetical protein
MMWLLFLQLIFLLFLLIVIGEPLRAFFLRHLKLFSNLDFLQICILDVYLGGLILYVVAMLPFRLFSWFVVFCFAVLSFFLSIIIHRKALTRFASFSKIRVFLVENKKIFLDYLLVFAMFTFFLVLNLFSLSGLVIGSVHDESIHSLHVQVILENNYVPASLEPYLPEGIIYPQASHVIFAFACFVLNMDVPKVVFYVTVLFKALCVFGAYFLGKSLSSSRAYSLGLSFVFTFISSWPLSVVWGGNPFLVGFPLFLVCLGLFFSMFCPHRKNSFAELIAVGLLFGYAGSIIISYLQTLLMIAFLFSIYYVIRKNRRLSHTLLEFAMIFCVSLIPVSPFLFRFFAFYPYPGHNIGLPSDFAGWQPQQFYLTQALQWAFENLSPYVLLRVIILLLLISFAVLLWRTKDYQNVKSMVAFALVIFVAAALLSFISFFLSADFGVISWGHQGIILSISINILIIVFFVKLYEFCNKRDLGRMSKIFPKVSHATNLLTIALLFLIISPFLYHRILLDPGVLQGAYNMFAVTTQGDYDLMLWMKGNLSSDAVILVHPNGSGLFIPSISQHKIVFPYSGSSLSSSYQTLVSLLENKTLDITTYRLMQHLNVSYVYVGPDTIYRISWYPKWYPKLFLGNPNFKLVKNFGDAYLFKLEGYNPDIVFLDDFEYSTWEQNRWQNNFLGNGLGNVTITSGFGYNNSRCLKMTTQAVPTVWNWESKYAYWVSREIFVLNNSDVTFSFYLDATQGFDGNDTFAVLISDIYSSQSMVITTPNGIFSSYANAITLEDRHGSFSFDLSRQWRQLFNSTLPNSFILQFANYDFDGIKNVAYIDDVKVISRAIY